MKMLSPVARPFIKRRVHTSSASLKNHCHEAYCLPVTIVRRVFRLMMRGFWVGVFSSQIAMASTVTFDDLDDPEAFPVGDGLVLLDTQLSASFDSGYQTTSNILFDAQELSGSALESELNLGAVRAGKWGMLAVVADFYDYQAQDAALSAADFDSATITVLGTWNASESLTLNLAFIDSESLIGVSPDDQLNGIGRGVELDNIIELQAEYAWTDWRVGVKTRFNDTKTEQTTAFNDVLVNDSLNRDERATAVYVGYQVSSALRLDVYTGQQKIDYVDSIINLANLHDSTEDRLGMLLSFSGESWQVDGDLYWFNQDFVSPAIQDLNDEWQLTLKAQYSLGEQSELLFATSRKFNETNIPGVAGLMTDNVFVGASFMLTPRTLAKFGYQYQITEPVGTSIELSTSILDVDLRFNVSKHVSLGLRYEGFSEEPDPSYLEDFNFEGNSLKAYVSLML